MKRKNLLFALLLALFMPWAANAQNRALVTIGDGTTTTYYPMPGFYGYQYDVYLYTPSAAQELGVDSEISSLAFDVASNNANTGAEMYIWVKDVDADYALAAATTFNEYITDATQVYSNDEFTSTSGWNTFSFESAFSHEGGNALLVAIRSVGCTTSGGCSRSCRYTSASNTWWNKHVDSSDPGQNVSGTVGTSRANIQLDLTYSGAVCFTPSGLTYTNVVENAATLSWNENGSSTAWVLEYSTASDFAGATTVNVSGTPTTSLSGLSALTTYYVRVKADCGSDWLTGSFTTTAHAEAVGNAWSDDFEGTACEWELVNGTQTNVWAWGTAVNNGGSHSLYVSNDNGTTNAYSHTTSTVFATKLLNFTEGKFEFSYNWKANGESTYDYLRVALVPATVTLTAGTIPSGFSTTGLPSGWIALDGGSKLNLVTAWQSKSLAINVTAGNYYLVMAWRNDGGGGTQPPAAVDNVSITRMACPYDVTDLAVSNITTTGATLTWTAGEAEQWQVVYSTNSTFEGATEEIVSAATYTMTGLQPSTRYYAKVRAYCGGEDFGSWSSVFDFFTDCAIIPAVGYTENFDSYTAAAGVLPICWNKINTTTYSSYQGYPRIYNYSSQSSPNCLYFYSYYSSYYDYYDPQDQYAILPEMENLAGKLITLSARANSNTVTFKIGLMTDPADATTFTEMATQALTTSYQEFEYVVPADATAHYIAIMMEAASSSSTTRNVYIDDITIAEAPTCLKPTELEATANALTATITWVSEVGEYEVAYATEATATPDENIAGTATEETYTMNDLALGDHYFWVRANCGSDGYSEWVGPVNVHIGYCVPNPTSHDGSGITGVSFGMGDYVVENGGEGTSIPASAPYYGDYSNMIGAVQAGVESTIAITTGTGSYPYTFVIWVDFDNSLSFEDNEVVYVGKASSGSGTHNATITVPATQATGDYRMRIYGADSYFNSFYGNGTINWEADHDPCSSGSYRHANDYTLRVLEAPSCLMPTGLAVNYTGGNTATVTWEGTAETYNIDVNGTVTNNVTTPYTLGNLEMATTYAVMVQANCEEEETSEWTEAVSFTTDLCMPEDQCEITFELTDQYGDGWSGCGIKVIDVLTNSVIATMEAVDHDSWQEETDIMTLAVCDGREIQFVWVSGSYANECSYVVKDANGVEIFSGEDAMTEPVNYTVICGSNITLEKHIIGYASDEEEGSNGNNYYLIASPLADAVAPTTVGGMITDEYGTDVDPTTSTYDLYSFDESEDLEWQNYRASNFSLVNGQGYLYASKNGTTLTFTGAPYSGTTKEVTLQMTENENADFQGWNLVGNPFTDLAYIDRPFYRMDPTGTRVLPEPQDGAIQVMEGVFVIATEDEELMEFSTVAPNNDNKGLVLNLSQGRGNTIDRAIVGIGQGRTLPKFMFNPNDTKLYIPQNGKDYAVVRGRVSDEIPVNFLPTEDGYYNISVVVRNMNLRSLVLKDKVRNVSIDLLRTPNYMFKASAYDRADRFVLSFKNGNGIYKEKYVKGANPEDFCFYSNGVFVIDNEGEANLQVIDLNGRVLSSENIYGSTSIQVDAAPGIYLLRLTNGDNVKVQKVVVE